MVMFVETGQLNAVPPSVARAVLLDLIQPLDTITYTLHAIYL